MLKQKHEQQALEFSRPTLHVSKGFLRLAPSNKNDGQLRISISISWKEKNILRNLPIFYIEI
ncbi:hypothetical protein Mapa_004327 [Marchantia paleacea]|nr:hypothetical protein Mapa_004327 [Marchantia paleacea]